MTTRKVRGLLDIMTAEADRADWEFEKPSADYLPGLGLGATPEARRWAWLGYCAEKAQWQKRKRGRPRKSNLSDVDCYRAYVCWLVVKSLGARRVQNREAIRLVRLIDDHLSIPVDKRAFPPSITDESAEQSLSRGRRKAGMNVDWQSDYFEAIANIP